MTQEEVFAVLAKFWTFIVRCLAMLGFATVIALGSYTFHKNQEEVRTANCINSACDLPCTKKFQRHRGDCESLP